MTLGEIGKGPYRHGTRSEIGRLPADAARSCRGARRPMGAAILVGGVRRGVSVFLQEFGNRDSVGRYFLLSDELRRARWGPARRRIAVPGSRRSAHRIGGQYLPSPCGSTGLARSTPAGLSIEE